MDRAESGSLPDTMIGRLSPEDDRKRTATATASTFAVVESSSSSLDTVVGPGMEEKKKGRFGALKRSFRKEGSIFHIKKRTSKVSELESSVDFESEHKEKEKDKNKEKRKESSRAKVAEEKASKGNEEATLKPMKKKKKSHSLVRKLSLNKFRAPSEQPEPRRTPEGGDSSRSLSQSSPDSQSQSDSPSRPNLEVVEKPLVKPKSPSTPQIQKTVSTVTVVSTKSPQLTIKSKDRPGLLSPERSAAVKKHFERVEENIAKTFPDAFDVWPPPDRKPEQTKLTNSDSGSDSELSPSPQSCLTQRKKVLAEERRAFFQRRKYEPTTVDTSGETVVEVDVEDENAKRDKAEGQKKTQKKARQISVRKFDTFSTFEGTFDEDTGVGYLAGIEEDRPNSLDIKQRDGDQSYQDDMAYIAASADRSRSISQESASSQNNVPSTGVSEKREHLYKILVIGELGAGKTSIIKRYVHQFFSQHYRATIGVDFALKVLNWDPNTIIRLQLWDIAGQERFGNMTRVYYKEAVGAFIVFDVTRSATLEAVVKWKQDLDSKVQLPDGSPIPCVLLANKCDQQKEGLVNVPSKMDEYCKEKNFAGWFETSAKENINIEEAARFLVGKILQNDVIMKGNESQDQKDNERFALNQSPNGLKKSCSC